MKIKLVIAALLVLCFFSSCASGSGEDTTAKETEAVPENGVYYEYSSDYSDRVISSITYENGKEISRNEYEYWLDGKLRTITTTAGSREDIWNYNYSADGILSQMVRQYTENGREYRDDYRYTDSGSLASLSVYEDNEFAGGERFTYNDKGDTTLEERLDANGDVIAYTEYSFDEKGRTAGSVKYMYGSEMGRSIYEYNEKGLLLTVSNLDSYGELESKVVNEYDGEDKVTRVKTCTPDGDVIAYTECLYDKDGFNYRDVFYEDGEPVYCYDYTKEGARIYSAYN